MQVQVKDALPGVRADVQHRSIPGTRYAALDRQLRAEDFWQVLLAASKAGDALDRAVTAGEPAHVAKYAFQIAQGFNNFYHQYPVIHEENREKKVFLLWMTDFFRRQLERTLDVLGIEVPPYM